MVLVFHDLSRLSPASCPSSSPHSLSFSRHTLYSWVSHIGTPPFFGCLCLEINNFINTLYTPAYLTGELWLILQGQILLICPYLRSPCAIYHLLLEHLSYFIVIRGALCPFHKITQADTSVSSPPLSQDLAKDEQQPHSGSQKITLQWLNLSICGMSVFVGNFPEILSIVFYRCDSPQTPKFNVSWRTERRLL